jgi:hypothetical protein
VMARSMLSCYCPDSPRPAPIRTRLRRSERHIPVPRETLIGQSFFPRSPDGFCRAGY